MKPFHWLWLLVPIMGSALSFEQRMQRIDAFLVLQDGNQALFETKLALKEDPNNLSLHKKLYQSLSLVGSSSSILEFYHKHPSYDRKVLEEMSWAVLQSAAGALHPTHKKIALIGGFLTQDVKGVELIAELLSDESHAIRQIAASLAVQMPDMKLHKAVKKRLQVEKDFRVRVQLTEALGALRGVDVQKDLLAILKANNSTEEKEAAISSLVRHTKAQDLDSWLESKDPIEVIVALDGMVAFEKKEKKDLLYSLFSHPNFKVRATAMITARFLDQSHEQQDLFIQKLKDPQPLVQIVASWASWKIDPKKAGDILTKWILSKNTQYKRIAAIALASLGPSAVDLIDDLIDQTEDPYCKVNLAKGLLNNRASVKKAHGIIQEFLQNEDLISQNGAGFRQYFSGIWPQQKQSNLGAMSFGMINSMVQLELIDLLLATGADLPSDIVEGYLAKTQFGIGIEALHRLFTMQPAATLEKIEQYLKSKDLHIRVQAALICAFFGKLKVAMPTLLNAFPLVDREMKLNIIDALIHIKRFEAIPFFLKTIKEDDEILQIASAAGILCSLR